MNLDVLVTYSSLLASPHFLGCPCVSPQIHPDHLLLTHTLMDIQKTFCPQPGGYCLSVGRFVYHVLPYSNNKFKETLLISPLGFVSSANWSHFIHSPTNNFLMYQTPYKDKTHPFKCQMQPILRYCL